MLTQRIFTRATRFYGHGRYTCHMDKQKKNPKRVEAGRKAAVTRWGEPRVLRLDDMSPEQRRFVLALLDVWRANRKNEDD